MKYLVIIGFYDYEVVLDVFLVLFIKVIVD